MKKLTYFMLVVLFAAWLTESYAQSVGALRKGAETPIADSIRKKFAGGDGTVSSPLQIADARQMIAFLGLNKEQVGSASFVLTRSVNFKQDLKEDASFAKDKSGRVLLEGINYFSGIFDGGGHALSGFVLVGGESSSSALFCKLSGAKLINLTLSDVGMMQSEESQKKLGGTAGFIGILAGNATDLTVDNCHVENATLICSGLHMSNIGALVGWADKCLLTNISARNINITFRANSPVNYSPSGVGLLVGYAKNCSIGNSETTCVATGSILVDIKDAQLLDPQVGGAVGRADENTWLENITVGGSNEARTVITYNHNSTVLKNTGIGGFIGYAAANAFEHKNGKIIENCCTYADVTVGWSCPGPVGNVSGGMKPVIDNGHRVNVGGFVGFMLSSSNIHKSTSYGNVTLRALKTGVGLDGIAVGGFVGNLQRGAINSSTWYGRKVALSVPEGWDNDFLSQIGEFIAVGGFAGTVGNLDFSPSYAQLWNCRIGLPSTYAASPKITRKMRFDSYVFGVEPIEQMEKNYVPATHADSTLYAHHIDAALSVAKLVASGNHVHNSGTGGFVGFSCGQITECYAESMFVEGTLHVGGFVGTQHSRYEYDTYETTSMIQTKKCLVRDVYVSGTSCVGGFAGQAARTYQYNQNNLKIPVEEAAFSECCAINVNDVEIRPAETSLKMVPCVGGFIGWMEHLVIDQCEVLSTIGIAKPNSGVFYTGGMAGMCSDGAIDRSLVMGVVSVAYSSNIGGIIGWADNTRVNRSMSMVHLYCDNAEGAGGIAGTFDDGSIQNSFVLGAITPYGKCDNHGGIAGYLDNCVLNNSYAVGPVELVNKPEQVRKLIEDMLKLVFQFAPSKPDKMEIAMQAGTVIIDLIKVGSNTKPSGNAGGIAGYMPSPTGLINYKYTYWDKSTTTQTSACKAIKLKTQGVDTKKFLTEFNTMKDPKESDAHWSNIVFGYYVPFEAEKLFSYHMETMKKAGFAQ